MVHKSWGGPETPSVGSRPEDPAQRAADRVEARKARLQERTELTARRQDARIVRREADRRTDEQARAERRDQEEQRATADPHAAGRPRRGSGRRDIVREQRDTSAYAMIVDAGRIRTLAARGASASSLSAVFGISEEEVRRVLSEGP